MTLARLNADLATISVEFDQATNEVKGFTPILQDPPIEGSLEAAQGRFMVSADSSIFMSGI